MASFIFFLCVVLIGSILQTSTGFGFSILATPLLLLLFHPQEAIQINIILSLVISVLLIRAIRNEIDYRLLKRLVVSSMFGVPLGILIYVTINITLFKLAVGLLLLALTTLLIINLRVKPTRNRDFLTGGSSGLFTTSIGMPDPPLLLYFTGTDKEKDKLRATTLAFYLFIYSISLITQIIFAGTSSVIWTYGLYGIPAVVFGLLAGQYIFRWINQKMFRIFTYILLGCTGAYLLIESLVAM